MSQSKELSSSSFHFERPYNFPKEELKEYLTLLLPTERVCWTNMCSSEHFYILAEDVVT